MTAPLPSDAPPSSSPQVSRRALLGASAAVAVAAVPVAQVALAGEALAAPALSVSEASVLAERASVVLPAKKTKKKRKKKPSRGTVTHLLRRTTYGPTPALIGQVTKLGTKKWLEQQLAPAKLADPMGDALRKLYPESQWTVAQVYQQVAAGRIDRFSWDVMFPLSQYSLAMATWSSRQLYEVMVDFWSNHLNVANPSDSVWDNRQHYDRVVIRANAMGKFSTMLQASAAHPAMLNYLNQADSTKDAPNENYGREILELHTVGVGAGYTEAMVLDSARIMTGYTLQWDEGQPRYREFVYDRSIHWTGRVRVLGFSHANASSDGRAVAAAYISYLAHHPATAKRIARKLAVRFVSDNPSTALVNKLAAVYLKYDTAIVPVLRVLLTSPEFKASRWKKVRRPYEDLVGTLRALGYRPLAAPHSAVDRRAGIEALYWRSNTLQQPPLAWAQPDGYPDVAAAWTAGGGLLERWNMHLGLAAGWWPGTDTMGVPDAKRLLPAVTSSLTYGKLVDAVAVRLTGLPLPASHAAAVLTFLGKRPADRVGKGDRWVTWDVERFVALVLDTPNHQLR
ncbi:MAG: DUF1800 domain-containing protein [Candidatus Nanopelagicales bacterium]